MRSAVCIFDLIFNLLLIDLDVVDLDTLDQEEDITEDTGVINEEDED